MLDKLELELLMTQVPVGTASRTDPLYVICTSISEGDPRFLHLGTRRNRAHELLQEGLLMALGLLRPQAAKVVQSIAVESKP